MKASWNKNMNCTSIKTRVFVLLVVTLLIAGCGKDSDDGSVINTVQLPTDDSIPFVLRCTDVGIKNETCILDDSNNPYSRAAVNEGTKFGLDADAPSFTAKFYLWGTALARGAGAPGENQFYTALNLHRMWAASNSEITRLQAIRAYRSLLDNYFNSVTFFEIPIDSKKFFPQNLNRFTGQLLFTPTDLTNTFPSSRLFSEDANVNKDLANQEIGTWGYFYDQNTQQFIKNF
jgi:hypothetical protein